ncbi:MAG: family phosphatase [Ignavibacteria bacterium]|nr:family phosphatase [Ignavibacteria bacterium]
MENMIKNFIFDFGNVLYRIAPERTFERFAVLTNKPLELVFDFPAAAAELIEHYEAGLITSIEFRQGMKVEYGLSISDKDFDAAWNLTLVGLYDDSIAILEKFESIGRIFLLSNTSEIHYDYFEQECREMFALFEQHYFSYRLGMVKPDPHIFELVIKERQLNPAETLFIDDSIINIKSAEQCNLKVHHLENHDSLKAVFLSYFAKYSKQI